jgi:spoIIIJ-associated protein
METVEITAASKEEAIAAAAEKLGVPAAKLKVTVVEETKGLFGKGQVTIKAEAKAAATKGKTAKTAVAEPEPEPVVEAKPAKAPRGKKAAEPVVEAAPVAEEKPAKPARGKKASAEAKPADADADGEEGAPEVVATEEDANKVLDLISDILSSGNLDAEAQLTELNGRYVNLRVDGPDASFLLGKRGEVLNAFQYLVNVIVGRKVRPGVRVVLDCDAYRERRRQILTDQAVGIAHEVIKRQEEAVLDALPAFERRVVHQALSEITGVVTYSEGEEPNRRIVIAPAEA